MGAREEGRVLVIRAAAHGVDGGEVYIAGGWMDRQHVHRRHVGKNTLAIRVGTGVRRGLYIGGCESASLITRSNKTHGR